MTLANTLHRGKPRTDIVMDPPYTWAINKLQLQLLNSKGGEKKVLGTDTISNLLTSLRELPVPAKE